MAVPRARFQHHSDGDLDGSEPSGHRDLRGGERVLAALCDVPHLRALHILPCYKSSSHPQKVMLRNPLTHCPDWMLTHTHRHQPFPLAGRAQLSAIPLEGLPHILPTASCSAPLGEQLWSQAPLSFSHLSSKVTRIFPSITAPRSRRRALSMQEAASPGEQSQEDASAHAWLLSSPPCSEPHISATPGKLCKSRSYLTGG